MQEVLIHFSFHLLKNYFLLIAGFIIPQRWVLGIMGFLAVVMAYAMRVCLSMAIVKMVRPHEDDPEYDDHTCSFNSTEGDNEHSGVCIIN